MRERCKKMITYKKLQKEFEKKVEELRKKCPHKKLSNWCEEWWAMAHSTGFEVKACEICREIIKRRIACMNCEKVTEDYVNGDGKIRPIGEYFCKKCDEVKMKPKSHRRN